VTGFGEVEFAEECDGFAEVDAVAEFENGRLASEDFFAGGGLEEIIGEAATADAGAGGAEKLEEGAVAENVKVGRVGMV